MLNRLKNTRSGAAGEASVIAVFMRCGLDVDKPLQNDDEIDLSIRVKKGSHNIAIPVQVKSVQFSKESKHKFIQGLKKKYLESQPYLCLAIYRPDINDIWFIHGSKRIQEVYTSQSIWNFKHRQYSSLSLEDDVRIALPRKDKLFDAQWKIPNNEPANFVEERFQELFDEIERKTILIENKNPDISVETNCRIIIEIEDNCENVSSKIYEIEGKIKDLIPKLLSILSESVIPRLSYLLNIDYSHKLLRELLLNAIVHRSYDQFGDIIVKFTKNTLQIENPGNLLPPLSIENHQIIGQYVVIRNEQLAEQLRQEGFIELVGCGLLWISKILQNYNLPPAYFTQDATSFCVTINFGTYE